MRLVDADEIVKCFDPNTWQGDMMISIVANSPTIELKRGEWIQGIYNQNCDEDYDEVYYVDCSECGHTEWDFEIGSSICEPPKYCPNCGAKMDKE